jgi:hypothetical protein
LGAVWRHETRSEVLRRRRRRRRKRRRGELRLRLPEADGDTRKGSCG